MRNITNIGLGLLVWGCIFMGVAAQVHGAPADLNTKGGSGTLACGGTNMSPGGMGLRTLWMLRNFDEKYAINIDRIRIYGADGSAIVDKAGSDVIPTNNFGEAGDPPNAAVIGPNQTLMFTTMNLEAQFPGLVSFSGIVNRPLQFIVDWSTSKQRVLILDGRAIIEKFNASGEALTRHLADCRTIK